LTLKVGGAEGARTPDPHNAIVLIPIALEALANTVKNIDRFIDTFFPDSAPADRSCIVCLVKLFEAGRIWEYVERDWEATATLLTSLNRGDTISILKCRASFAN